MRRTEMETVSSVRCWTVTSPGRKPIDVRQDEWSFRVTQTIARQIAAYRGLQTPRLTTEQLSRRCGELGHPIARSTISGLESGRKDKVSVAELLVLAEALGVTPIALLLPLDQAVVEISPNMAVPTDVAAQWLTGQGPPLDARVWSLLMHSNARVTCEEAFADLRRDVETNLDGGGTVHTAPDATRLNAERARGGVRLLASRRREMIARQQTPPELSPDMRAVDEHGGEDRLIAEIDRLEALAIHATDPDSAPDEVKAEIELRRQARVRTARKRSQTILRALQPDGEAT